MLQRVASKALEQIAGSGVSLDEEGRLCFPDGLDPPRVHRFVEHVLEESFDNPKAAMHAIYVRVGVAPRAIELLDEILDDEATIDWPGVSRHPIALAREIPHLREIPLRFREFLVEGLGLANAEDDTLEKAVVSTRLNGAERLGCKPTWNAILAEGQGISELSREWRES